jgi:hypothetical protein
MGFSWFWVIGSGVAVQAARKTCSATAIAAMALGQPA